MNSKFFDYKDATFYSIDIELHQGVACYLYYILSTKMTSNIPID